MMNFLYDLINFVNGLISALVLAAFLALTSVLPRPPVQPATSNQQPETRIATPTAVLRNELPSYPSNRAIEQSNNAAVPWGTTEKIGEHLYRTYVANEERMGTPEEILLALNEYRKTHLRGEVKSDEGLCRLANWRAEVQEQIGNLDSHKGLEEYMKDENHWRQLNIKAIGENASYGYVLSGQHLIEWVFDADSEHRNNQLNPEWNLACAGVSGVTVDIIFGER